MRLFFSTCIISDDSYSIVDGVLCPFCSEKMLPFLIQFHHSSDIAVGILFHCFCDSDYHQCFEHYYYDYQTKEIVNFDSCNQENNDSNFSRHYDLINDPDIPF